MSLSQIAIPIPTKLFLAVLTRLRETGSDRDPVDAIHHAIEAWLSASAPKHDRSRASEDVRHQDVDERDGYWWKLVFLPSGTKVRMTYRGRMAQAEVSSSGINYQGQPLTPSEFTHRVTNTNRNAWRDIELLFPDSESWVSADDLRKDAQKLTS
jgi:hypothetical protein